MKAQRNNFQFLTQAPVHRVILTMAVPTIISMLVTSFYNMADTYFMGRINTQCTAAVGVTFCLMSAIQAVGFFFGHGSGNFISRRLGARQRKVASVMAATGWGCSFLTGLLIAIVGWLVKSDLATWLGATPTIQPYAEKYLGIVLIGAPLMTTSLTMNNQMRFQGNAAYSMVGIFTGALLNVALDPLFIFTFHMGISGAAWATVISQLCSFCILLHMMHRGGNIPIRLRLFSPTLTMLREIVLGGTPSLSRQGLAAASTLALNVAAGGWGDAAIAGMSIVSRVCFFVFAVIIGLGQGFQPLCGFSYGARLYNRVREGFTFCLKLGTAFLIVTAILGAIFAEPIVQLFRHDPEVVAIGTRALRWQLLTFPLLSMVGLSNMFLQTIRKPIQANLAAASRSGLFFVPLILTLPHFLGLTGVEICQAVSDLCAFALCTPMALLTLRGMDKGK